MRNQIRLDRHQVLLFVLEGLIDLPNIVVVQLLVLFHPTPLIVLTDLLVLFHALQALVAFSSRVSHGVASHFRQIVSPLDDFPAALFGQGGTGRRTALPSLDGLRPIFACMMAFSMAGIRDGS